LANILQLKDRYDNLAYELPIKDEQAIDSQCLLAFEYDYPDQGARVDIETDEFTAVCPWTGLPDLGTLRISYTPDQSCIELKSLKYYLLSYRDVGIVQEHAANKILKDLVGCCQPRHMQVTLDYQVRGGIHTSVSVEYPGPNSKCT
jgi:7-cyano-7-deazaguanine reductase